MSGIARPENFERVCLAEGLNAVASVRFEDHHWYGEADHKRLRDLMAELFPAGAWQLDHPKVVETDRAILLFDEYKNEQDGTVSLCRLQSSDMNAPVLAQQVVDRVRNFDFGSKEAIVAMTIIYPIDFLPAA